MNPEAQRIAIAEACGWTYTMRVVPYIRPEPFHDWTDPEGKNHGITGPAIPDYVYDLNGMHEAEKVLSDEQWDDYTHELNEVIGRSHRLRFSVHATAAQRAEAFLRTVGKWKEGQ